MAPRTEPLVWLGAAVGDAPALLVALDDVPETGAFNLLASRERCADALRIATEMPDRVLALVLESPDCMPDPRVTVPTLVVAGTANECSAGAAFRAQLPNCHYVLVYAAGNDVAQDRPAAFSALVEDFLERRERFIVSQRSGLLHP
jgi:hypothetical protein